MSLRGVQRQAAAHYGDLGSDLASTIRPQRPLHRTSELPTTTRLLRNSRLFSLPKPLRAPDVSQTAGIRSSNSSDTATLPYPTHAAVITHAKAFGRGDWGLKRALPGKAFKTTTPVVRIKNVDTIDHITEFESAADHVFTLQKVQELNIPLTVPKSRDMMPRAGAPTRQKPATSVFDAFADPMDRPTQRLGVAGQTSGGSKGWGVEVAKPSQVRRWRFDSPWIAGMAAGEFELYLHSTVKSKRAEFRDWLRKRLAEKRSQSKRTHVPSLNVDAGLGSSDTSQSAALASRVVEEISQGSQVPTTDSFEQDILDLRNHPRELWMLVWEFFDLPGRFPSEGSNLTSYAEDNVDVEHGPPTTHPSAGLSYLRPVTQLYNHPALGPMAQTAPVPTRLLQRSGRGNDSVYGVAGVAVEKQIDTSYYHGPDAGRDISSLKAPGGPKGWAHAKSAEIDSKGGIRMKIDHAHQDTVDVWNPKPLREGGEKRRWGTQANRFGRNQMPDFAPLPSYKKI